MPSERPTVSESERTPAPSDLPLPDQLDVIAADRRLAPWRKDAVRAAAARIRELEADHRHMRDMLEATLGFIDHGVMPLTPTRMLAALEHIRVEVEQALLAHAHNESEDRNG